MRAAAMETDHSSQSWIGALKQRDEQAAPRLWEQYFERLVRTIERKLSVIRRIWEGMK